MQQKSLDMHFNLLPDLSNLRPYTLLVAIPPPQNNNNSQTTIIGSFGTPPSSSYIKLHTPLTLTQIQLLDSCSDHGTVHIPTHEPSLATFLQREINHLTTSSQDPQIVTKLIANLHSHTDASNSDTIEVRILSITVLGEESSDPVIPQGCKLLWKWAKPQSQYYRKSGFWNYSLTRVLVDAEWNAGKGVLVLVKAVEEDEYERVVRGEMKT